MTCHFRCGDACDQPIPNQSGHPHVRDEINAALARRTLLQGAALGGTATLVGTLVGGAGPAAAAPTAAPTAAPLAARPRPDRLHAGCTQQARRPRRTRRVPARCHHPLGRRRGARRSAVRRQRADPGGSRRAVRLQLRLRRPARARERAQPGAAGGQPRVHQRGPDVPRRRLRRRHHQADRDGLARHERGQGEARDRRRGPGCASALDSSRQNRRITASTPFRVVGPAAGNQRLQTAADPSGRPFSAP